MRKFLLALPLALTLCGCITPGDVSNVLSYSTPNPITNQRLAAIEESYIAVLGVAAWYRGLYDTNPCPLGYKVLGPDGKICSNRSTVLKMQAAVAKCRTARKELIIFVKNNPTLDAGTLITTVEQAISDFNQVVPAKGS